MGRKEHKITKKVTKYDYVVNYYGGWEQEYAALDPASFGRVQWPTRPGSTVPFTTCYMMVLELCHHKSLTDWIKCNPYSMVGKQPEGNTNFQRWNFAAMIANGLAALHNDNIVHCDVKPDNILLSKLMVEKHRGFFKKYIIGTFVNNRKFNDRGIEAKLSDYGLSHKRKFWHAVVPRAGRILVGGTKCYMPHEVRQEFDKNKPQMPRSSWDIYSFGVVLRQLFDLYHPPILGGQLKGEHELHTEAERAAYDIANKCCAFNKNDRPTAAALEAWFSNRIRKLVNYNAKAGSKPAKPTNQGNAGDHWGKAGWGNGYVQTRDDAWAPQARNKQAPKNHGKMGHSNIWEGNYQSPKPVNFGGAWASTTNQRPRKNARRRSHVLNR